jgi:hypothetical protein
VSTALLTSPHPVCLSVCLSVCLLHWPLAVVRARSLRVRVEACVGSRVE